MRRIRFLAGTLALAALLISFAQGVWASVCSPAMEMVSPAVPTSTDSMAGMHDADMPADHCAHHAPSDSPLQDTPAPSPCPFMPMTVSSCASAVSLPAEARLDVSAQLENVVSPPVYHALSEILLSSALFHPPKA